MGAAAIAFSTFVSQKLFRKWFFKSQFPQKSVNVSFTIANVKNKLTN